MIGSGSDLIRQREPNMDLDGGLMFMFTFSGSDDEHPSGQTEHHGVASIWSDRAPWSSFGVQGVLAGNRADSTVF